MPAAGFDFGCVSSVQAPQGKACILPHDGLRKGKTDNFLQGPRKGKASTNGPHKDKARS
jgi:hypothetical protein